jgi:hypothetical protein
LEVIKPDKVEPSPSDDYFEQKMQINQMEERKREITQKKSTIREQLERLEAEKNRLA